MTEVARQELPDDVRLAMAAPAILGTSRELLKHGGMLPVEQIFAESYIRCRDLGKSMQDALVQTEGARFYQRNRRSTHQLRAGGRAMLNRPMVQKYCDLLHSELRELIALDKEYFAARLLEMADLSIEDVMEQVYVLSNGDEAPDNPTETEAKDMRVIWRMRTDAEPHVLRLMQEVEFNDFGGVKKMKMPDKLKSLISAAEMLGVKQDVAGAIKEASGSFVEFLDGIANNNQEKPLLPSEAEALDNDA